MELNSGGRPIVPVIIGTDILSKLHLDIAYGEKKIYVSTATPASATPVPENTPVH